MIDMDDGLDRDDEDMGMSSSKSTKENPDDNPPGNYNYRAGCQFLYCV